MTWLILTEKGLHRWLSGKEAICQCRRCRRLGFNPWVGKISWRRKWPPIPVFLPEKSHGQRSLVGYSPWDSAEVNKTKHACTRKTKTYTLTLKGWLAF